MIVLIKEGGDFMKYIVNINYLFNIVCIVVYSANIIL